MDRRLKLVADPWDARDVGELTFVLTKIIVAYLVRHGLKFENIAAIKGAFRSALDDFDDRVVTPYERMKCLVNSDVWPASLIPGRPLPPMQEQENQS